MKKEIIELMEFFALNSDKCMRLYDDVLAYRGNLILKITSDFYAQNNDLVKVSIVDKSRDIFSDYLPIAEAESSLKAIWKKVEENRNFNFAKTYGQDNLNKLYNTFLNFIKYDEVPLNCEYKKQCTDGFWNFEISNQEFKMSALIDNKGANEEIKSHYSLMVVVEARFKTTKHDEMEEGLKEVKSSFNICIPAVEFKEYNLGLKIKSKDYERPIDYIISNVIDKNDIAMLQACKLNYDLPINEEYKPKTKKI